MASSLLPRPTDKIRMADWGHLKPEFDWVYEGNVAEPYRLSRSHHPGQSALLLTRGNLLVETKTGRIRAKKGQWILPHQGPRLQHFSEDACVLSIHFNLAWPGGQPLFNWDIAYILESSHFPLLEKQGRHLLRLADRHLPGARNDLPYVQGDLKTHFILQKSFTSWLALLIGILLDSGVAPSRLGQIDDRVLQAVSVLDDLPIEVAFDAGWLAHEVSLSPSQLDRLFIRQFGMTPRQYLEQRKLLRAFELMRSSPLNIKQIAYEVGFHSLPCFSRWFRQKTGISPRRFQKGDIFEYQSRSIPVLEKND